MGGYRIGSLPVLSDHNTRDLAQRDIFPTTSDDEIEELADEHVEGIRTSVLAEPDPNAVVTMLKEIHNQMIAVRINGPRDHWS